MSQEIVLKPIQKSQIDGQNQTATAEDDLWWDINNPNTSAEVVPANAPAAQSAASYAMPDEPVVEVIEHSRATQASQVGSGTSTMGWGFGAGLVAVGGIAAAAGGSSKNSGGGGNHTPSANLSPASHSNNQNNSQNSNPSTTPAPVPTADEATVTRAHYLNQITAEFSGKTSSKFDTGSLKYVGNAVKMDESNLLAKYTKIYGESKIKANIQAAYRPDSDHDGVIDIHDKNPNVWDVSERDLRLFAALAYAKEEEIKAIFEHNNETVISEFNQKRYGNYADVRELTGDWEVLKFHNGSDVPLLGSGLDYTIFGNGKKTDGGYQNVVITFRGTTNAADLGADGSIFLGWIPQQAKDTSQILRDLNQFKPEKINITGHSLGGYNTQYFLSHYLMNGNSVWANKFVHSAIFNPAILKTRLLSRGILKEARANTDQLLKTNYLDDTDKTHPIHKTRSTSYVIQGEWVSNLLGSYDNTTVLTNPNLNKSHSLLTFFQQDKQLKELFSKGYRVDSHYKNDDTDRDGLTDIQERQLGLNEKVSDAKKDTDRDGFSDLLEMKLGHDFNNAKDKIDLKHYYDIKSDEAEFLSVVTTETQSGKFVNAVGVEMFAQVIDNKLVYTKIANSTDTPIAWADEDWQAWQDSGSLIVQGTTQNNHLKGSLKNEILWGGKGNDTLDGYEGNDVLIGGAGDDWLRGGGGKDILIGGSGNNILDGGEGADRFVLSKQGFSTIVSFAAQEDKLDVSEFQAAFQESDGAKPTLSQILHESTQTGKAALIFDANSDTLSYQDKNGQLTALARFDADVTAEMLRNSLIV